jgi:catechol 2,3-dioxygenase
MAAPLSLRFSHVGVFCVNIQSLVDFYTRYLGFVITDRGDLRETELCFLSRDPAEHHQLVLVSGRPDGLANRSINQISFRIDSLSALQSFFMDLPLALISDLDPVNHGISWSIYFRDPEGNRLEIFADTEWYIDQPIKEALDLTLTETEIRAQTHAFCIKQPGFRPLVEWRRDLAAKIEQSLQRAPAGD